MGHLSQGKTSNSPAGLYGTRCTPVECVRKVTWVDCGRARGQRATAGSLREEEVARPRSTARSNRTNQPGSEGFGEFSFPVWHGRRLGGAGGRTPTLLDRVAAGEVIPGVVPEEILTRLRQQPREQEEPPGQRRAQEQQPLERDDSDSSDDEELAEAELSESESEEETLSDTASPADVRQFRLRQQERLLSEARRQRNTPQREAVERWGGLGFETTEPGGVGQPAPERVFDPQSAVSASPSEAAPLESPRGLSSPFPGSPRREEGPEEDDQDRIARDDLMWSRDIVDEQRMIAAVDRDSEEALAAQRNLIENISQVWDQNGRLYAEMCRNPGQFDWVMAMRLSDDVYHYLHFNRSELAQTPFWRAPVSDQPRFALDRRFDGDADDGIRPVPCSDRCAVAAAFLAQESVDIHLRALEDRRREEASEEPGFAGGARPSSSGLGVSADRGVFERAVRMNNLVAVADLPFRGDEGSLGATKAGLLEQWLYKMEKSEDGATLLRNSAQRFYATTVVHGWWTQSPKKSPFVMVTVTPHRVVVRYYEKRSAIARDSELLRRVYAWVREQVPFVPPASFHRNEEDLLIVERVRFLSQWQSIVEALQETACGLFTTRPSVANERMSFWTGAPHCRDYFRYLVECGVWFSEWALLTVYAVASVDEMLEYAIIYGGPQLTDLAPFKRYHCPSRGSLEPDTDSAVEQLGTRVMNLHVASPSPTTTTTSATTANTLPGAGSPDPLVWSPSFASIVGEGVRSASQREVEVKTRVVYTSRSLRQLYELAQTLLGLGAGTRGERGFDKVLLLASSSRPVFEGSFMQLDVDEQWRVVSRAFDPRYHGVINGMRFVQSSGRVGFPDEAVAEFFELVLNAADTGSVMSRETLVELDRALNPAQLLRSTVHVRERMLDCLERVINSYTTCKNMERRFSVPGQFQLYRGAVARFEQQLTSSGGTPAQTIVLPELANVVFEIAPEAFSSESLAQVRPTSSLSSTPVSIDGEDFLWYARRVLANQFLIEQGGFLEFLLNGTMQQPDTARELKEHWESPSDFGAHLTELMLNPSMTWYSFWYTNRENYFETHIAPAVDRVIARGGRVVVPLGVKSALLAGESARWPWRNTLNSAGAEVRYQSRSHMVLLVLDAARGTVSVLDANSRSPRATRDWVYFLSSPRNRREMGLIYSEDDTDRLRTVPSHGWNVYDLAWWEMSYVASLLGDGSVTVGDLLIDQIASDTAERLGWVYQTGSHVCFDPIHENDLFEMRRSLALLEAIELSLSSQTTSTEATSPPTTSSRILDIRQNLAVWHRLFDQTGECSNFSFVFAALTPVMGALAIDIPTLCYLLTFDSVFAFNTIRSLLSADFLADDEKKRFVLRCMKEVERFVQSTAPLSSRRELLRRSASVDEMRRRFFHSLPRDCDRT